MHAFVCAVIAFIVGLVLFQGEISASFGLCFVVGLVVHFCIPRTESRANKSCSTFTGGGEYYYCPVLYHDTKKHQDPWKKFLKARHSNLETYYEEDEEKDFLIGSRRRKDTKKHRRKGTPKLRNNNNSPRAFPLKYEGREPSFVLEMRKKDVNYC
jgi:hypothetical protein